MRALLLNGTLEPSPEPSSTEMPATVVAERLGDHGVATEVVRLADLDIPLGAVASAGRQPIPPCS